MLLCVTCGEMQYGMFCGIRRCGCVCVFLAQRSVFVSFACVLLCDAVCACCVCLCVMV